MPVVGLPCARKGLTDLTFGGTLSDAVDKRSQLLRCAFHVLHVLRIALRVPEHEVDYLRITHGGHAEELAQVRLRMLRTSEVASALAKIELFKGVAFPATTWPLLVSGSVPRRPGGPIHVPVPQTIKRAQHPAAGVVHPDHVTAFDGVLEPLGVLGRDVDAAMGLVIATQRSYRPRRSMNVDTGVGHLRCPFDVGLVSAGIECQSEGGGIHGQLRILIPDDIHAVRGIPLAIRAHGNRNPAQNLTVFEYRHHLGVVIHQRDDAVTDGEVR